MYLLLLKKSLKCDPEALAWQRYVTKTYELFFLVHLKAIRAPSRSLNEKDVLVL